MSNPNNKRANSLPLRLFADVILGLGIRGPNLGFFLVWVRFRVYNGVWRHVGLYKVGIDILKSFRYFEIVIEPLPPFRTSDMLRNTKKKYVT